MKSIPEIYLSILILNLNIIKMLKETKNKMNYESLFQSCMMAFGISQNRLRIENIVELVKMQFIFGISTFELSFPIM